MKRKALFDIEGPAGADQSSFLYNSLNTIKWMEQVREPIPLWDAVNALQLHHAGEYVQKHISDLSGGAGLSE